MLISVPAQMLEINVSGVLLGSKTELPAGARGALRATIGDRVLDVAVEIRSVAEETLPRGPRYRLGAAFVDAAAEQRLLLLELLRVERH